MSESVVNDKFSNYVLHNQDLLKILLLGTCYRFNYFIKHKRRKFLLVKYCIKRTSCVFRTQQLRFAVKTKRKCLSRGCYS